MSRANNVNSFSSSASLMSSFLLALSKYLSSKDSSAFSRTISSAVAVIADRTAYDARYTGKISNRFPLHVYAPKVYLLNRHH